ncbi:hypothetical protein [Nocardia sp. NPDC003963]
MTKSAYKTDLIPTTEFGAFAHEGAVVFELSPPHIHDEGVTSFVIAAVNHRAKLVDLFPAYDNGLLAEWCPLNPDCWGHTDPALALRELGYEVVSVDGRA